MISTDYGRCVEALLNDGVPMLRTSRCAFRGLSIKACRIQSAFRNAQQSKVIKHINTSNVHQAHQSELCRISIQFNGQASTSCDLLSSSTVEWPLARILNHSNNEQHLLTLPFLACGSRVCGER